MTQWHYRYAGLNIASELPIVEWEAFEASPPAGEPDVAIRIRDAAPTTAAHRSEEVSPREYRFVIRDAGEYCVRDGREIIVTPVPEAGAREIRLFILGSAFGALALQRGLLLLHASAVQTPAGAAAFSARAGGGKSTILSWLSRHGYRFLSDDLCPVDFGEDRAGIHPSTPRLKLWHDALDGLGVDVETLERDHYRTDKRHLRVPDFVASSSVPLRAVYLLDWGALEITPLHGLDGLRELVASATYRPDLLERMQSTEGHWSRCLRLMGHASIFRFSRPRNAAVLPETFDLLQAHLRNIIGLPDAL